MALNEGEMTKTEALQKAKAELVVEQKYSLCITKNEETSDNEVKLKTTKGIVLEWLDFKSPDNLKLSKYTQKKCSSILFCLTLKRKESLLKTVSKKNEC